MSADREALKIYVLPVSGGWFPMQLMLLSQIYQARLINAGGRFSSPDQYTPNICCSASGGNIANYIAMAGDWSDTGILRISSSINSEIFCRNWWPDYMSFLPTWVLGVFTGAVFRTGYGANILLNKIFTSKTIQKTEIWTGTYNQSTRSCELFCNKRAGDTHVWPLTYNRFLYRSMPLNFLGGNVTEIGKAIMASASIPLIFNSQTIGDYEYADGGVMYASPLTPLQDEICRIVTGVITPPDEMILDPSIPRSCNMRDLNVSEIPHEFENLTADQIQGLPRSLKKMQLVYFSSVNIDDVESSCKSDGISHMVGTIRGFTVSITLQDRIAAINILTQIAGGRRDHVSFTSHPNLDVHKLAGLLKEIDPYDYVLYLHVGENRPLDMTCFKENAINECIQRENNTYGAYIWFYNPNISHS
jgi:predicted acylesterase/phospholipase RssA